MIEYKEEYTDEPNFSLGRRGKSEREIWDIEDNGGFKKVTVNGSVENVSRYTKESVKNAVKEYQNVIESGESIAVLNMDDNFALPVSNTFAKITKLEVSDDNKVKATMVLTDTPNGNTVYSMLKNYGQERLTLKADGTCNGSNLNNIVNIRLVTE
jgi:hypothetical protein